MTTSRSPLAELPAGTRVGDLTLLRPLGAGGQGIVYLALPAGPGALLWRLLQRLPGGLSSRWRRRPAAGASPPGALRAMLSRFALPCALKLAEPARAAALHAEHALLAPAAAAHPHLGALYSRRRPGALRRDLGLAWLKGVHACHWLALDYVPGRPLSDLLPSGGPAPLAPAAALHIIAQVASALQHLHHVLGAAHLDVTPANIIVRRGAPQAARSWRGGSLHATLIDLGAAERLGRAGRSHVYGTGPYLAPERRAAPPAPPTPQADIYALGVLLAELVPLPARPPPLVDLIAGATRPDPGRRRAALPDMGAFLERLALVVHPV